MCWFISPEEKVPHFPAPFRAVVLHVPVGPQRGGNIICEVVARSAFLAAVRLKGLLGLGGRS